MDGRRRLAEPVTDGAPMRPAAGAAPVSRRARMRIPLGLNLSRGRSTRFLRRCLGSTEAMPIPRGAGIAAALAFVLASVAYDAGIINATFYTTLVIVAVLTSQIAGAWLEYVMRKGWSLLASDRTSKPAEIPTVELPVAS